MVTRCPGTTGKIETLDTSTYHIITCLKIRKIVALMPVITVATPPFFQAGFHGYAPGWITGGSPVEGPFYLDLPVIALIRFINRGATIFVTTGWINDRNPIRHRRIDLFQAPRILVNT
jgi:hypothetical protein